MYLAQNNLETYSLQQGNLSNWSTVRKLLCDQVGAKLRSDSKTSDSLICPCLLDVFFVGYLTSLVLFSLLCMFFTQ
jgi:hypothetical protein